MRRLACKKEKNIINNNNRLNSFKLRTSILCKRDKTCKSFQPVLIFDLDVHDIQPST